jgi:hypothetical protein
VARKLKQQLRGIAEPVLGREPLLLRTCSAFVNNLRLILQTAFIVCAILLARDFRSFTETLPHSVAEVEPVPARLEGRPIAEPEPQEPVLTERVKHYLNCTYEDYRITHYDECVEGPSRIYRGPQAEPDDMGNVSYDAPVRLARLDDYASFEQVRLN